MLSTSITTHLYNGQYIVRPLADDMAGFAIEPTKERYSLTGITIFFDELDTVRDFIAEVYEIVKAYELKENILEEDQADEVKEWAQELKEKTLT